MTRRNVNGLNGIGASNQTTRHTADVLSLAQFSYLQEECSSPEGAAATRRRIQDIFLLYLLLSDLRPEPGTDEAIDTYLLMTAILAFLDLFVEQP